MLASLLFGTYRQRVLGLLLLNPEQNYHVREIARLTNTAAGTLHKELARLAEAGFWCGIKWGIRCAIARTGIAPCSRNWRAFYAI